MSLHDGSRTRASAATTPPQAEIHACFAAMTSRLIRWLVFMAVVNTVTIVACIALALFIAKLYVDGKRHELECVARHQQALSASSMWLPLPPCLSVALPPTAAMSEHAHA